MNEVDGTQAKSGWHPAIPQPFWVWPWWALFFPKPMCCGRVFWSMKGYERHYDKVHLARKMLR